MQRAVSRRERRHLRACNLLTSINSPPPKKNHSFLQHILSGCAPSRNTLKKPSHPALSIYPVVNSTSNASKPRHHGTPLSSPLPTSPRSLETSLGSCKNGWFGSNLARDQGPMNGDFLQSASPVFPAAPGGGVFPAPGPGSRESSMAKMGSAISVWCWYTVTPMRAVWGPFPRGTAHWGAHGRCT